MAEAAAKKFPLLEVIVALTPIPGLGERAAKNVARHIEENAGISDSRANSIYHTPQEEMEQRVFSTFIMIRFISYIGSGAGAYGAYFLYNHFF